MSSEPRILATGLKFPEGPVAMQDGSVILGEIAGGTVTRVTPDGTKTTLSKAGGDLNHDHRAVVHRHRALGKFQAGRDLADLHGLPFRVLLGPRG